MSLKSQNINFARVTLTQEDAKNGTNYVDENTMLKEYWNDLDFVDKGDGTYLIEKDGVGMGWINKNDLVFEENTQVADGSSTKNPQNINDNPATKGLLDKYNRLVTEGKTAEANEVLKDMQILQLQEMQKQYNKFMQSGDLDKANNLKEDMTGLANSIKSHDNSVTTSAENSQNTSNNISSNSSSQSDMRDTQMMAQKFEQQPINDRKK